MSSGEQTWPEGKMPSVWKLVAHARSLIVSPAPWPPPLSKSPIHRHDLPGDRWGVGWSSTILTKLMRIIQTHPNPISLNSMKSSTSQCSSPNLQSPPPGGSHMQRGFWTKVGRATVTPECNMITPECDQIDFYMYITCVNYIICILAKI